MSENYAQPDGSGRREEALTEVAVFDVLSNERRRECIRQILERVDEGDVPVRTLSDAVARTLADDESPSENFQQSVYVSLTQTHLPMLADHDIVEYDKEKKRVAAGPNLHLLDGFLSLPRPSSTEEATEETDAPVVTDSPVDEEAGATEEGPWYRSSRFVRTVHLAVSLLVAFLLVVAVSWPASIPDSVWALLVLLQIVLVVSAVRILLETTE